MAYRRNRITTRAKCHSLAKMSIVVCRRAGWLTSNDSRTLPMMNTPQCGGIHSRALLCAGRAQASATLCPLWAHSKHVLQRELENALIAGVQTAADAADVLLNFSESSRVEGRYGKPGIQAIWKVEHLSA